MQSQDHFIQSASQNDRLRRKIKVAADSVETNITVETFRNRMDLKDDGDLNSLDVLNTITAIDDLRLHLNTRKQLGLEIAFQLQLSETDMENRFHQVEKLFWKNLSILNRFRNEIKAYRHRFLIFQDKKYPWWYPEKRKVRKEPVQG